MIAKLQNYYYMKLYIYIPINIYEKVIYQQKIKETNMKLFYIKNEPMYIYPVS